MRGGFRYAVGVTIQVTLDWPDPATAVKLAMQTQVSVALLDSGDNVGGGSRATALSFSENCCGRRLKVGW